jgi:hypothetical protein
MEIIEWYLSWFKDDPAEHERIREGCRYVEHYTKPRVLSLSMDVMRHGQWLVRYEGGFRVFDHDEFIKTFNAFHISEGEDSNG